MTKKEEKPKKEKKTKKKNKFEHHITLRNTTLKDYEDIKEIMDMVYFNMGGAWSKRQFAAQLSRFPEGQICIEDNGKVVAAAISMVVDYSKFGDNHTYWQITGRGFITNHDAEGDTLYGIDVFVHPDYQGLRLGRRLYDARKELCEKLNLKRIIAGGRIPEYKKYSDEITPQKYIEMVKNKQIFDPILTFQLANDFHVRKILTDYLPGDGDSKSYATLLEWLNIYYQEKEQLIGGKKTLVRVGCVQWQMREVEDFNALLKQVEFFVDAVAGYKSDFVIFPEFFNAALMAKSNEKSAPAAIRTLAEYTSKIRDKMLELAVSYNINIIAGSVPEFKNENLYNVSFLCRRDGTWDKQYKLHVTKDENMYWGLKGGDSLSVFDTDVGKIGILICYDVEFPELSRILAEKGMNILFVPYWTDTKNAYLRVRRCAQARAVENECYVVISGSVGNLPDIENMDIQYSQSAVFSPSDFSFPHDAIVAEATPNTEMTLVVDLDLDLLKEVRVHGSVTNLKDRRHDIYKISFNETNLKE